MPAGAIIGGGDGGLGAHYLWHLRLEITVPKLVLALPTESEDADRCTNRPLTPLTALKKFAEQRLYARWLLAFVQVAVFQIQRIRTPLFLSRLARK